MAAWRALAGDLNTNPGARPSSGLKERAPPPNTVQGNLRRLDGSYTETIEDTAELLLNAFVPDEMGDESAEFLGPLDERVESPSLSEVKASIWQIKPKKAPGLDGMNAKIIRKAWPVIGTSLTGLYSKALKESYFPISWRRANVIFIPKGGDKDPAITGAYRPISRLPVLGKALGILLIRNIESETNLNNIGEQHGFVQGKSTITAIQTMYRWAHESKSRHVMGTFVDITGAFDNVSWTPLLKQLDQIGASLRTMRITESYLHKTKPTNAGR